MPATKTAASPRARAAASRTTQSASRATATPSLGFDDPCYGTATVAVQATLKRFAKRMLPGCQPDTLRRVEANNGIAYWVPPGDQPVQVLDTGNGFDAQLGPDAAGIVLTGCVLAHLAVSGHPELVAASARLCQWANAHSQRQQIFDAWFTRAPAASRDPEWERIRGWTPSGAA